MFCDNSWSEKKATTITINQLFTFQMTRRQNLTHCTLIGNDRVCCLWTMTGAGKMRQFFLFILLISWWPELEKATTVLSSHFHFHGWPELEKKQIPFCLHPFTFMELVFNQSQGLTGIRLFPRAGIYKRARCQPAPDYTSSLTSAGSWCCHFCPTSPCGHLLGNSDPAFYVTFHAGG